MRSLSNLLQLTCLLSTVATTISDDNPKGFKDVLEGFKTKRSNILMLLPFSSHSHRNCFLPLARALADRGHQVVMLSGLPPSARHKNISEINHGAALPTGNMFELRDNGFLGPANLLRETLPHFVKIMYENPDVIDLYKRRNSFDLFIIDGLLNEIAFPFLVNKTYIALSAIGMNPMSSSILGNVLNPSYVSTVKVDFQRPFSFTDRMKNFLIHLVYPYIWREHKVYPKVEEELKKFFEDLPPLVEIEKGLVLELTNAHFTLDGPIPLLPSQVQVGCMHCRPGRKLPEDLQNFIENARHSVIYFSLGSICKGKTLPHKYRAIFVEAFGQLKQKVLWKYESDIDDLPKNVMVREWIPQQDVLAHENVKIFITHAGLLSVQESIYHAKPMVALPIFADQEKNALRVDQKGIGKSIVWEKLTVKLLLSTLKELLENVEHLHKVKNMSVAFRDQPESPLDRAIWWTEYVLRHEGAPHLKCPAADLSWREYLMIDVVISLQVAGFSVYWILKKFATEMCSKVVKKLFRNIKSKNNAKKKN